MKITADTNILVRAITGDDPVQSPIAERLLLEAELIAVPDGVLCEVCWVLASVYRFGKADIARAIQTLAEAANVAVDRTRVEAGLAVLLAGGDFADGVIAQGGRWLGGEVFASFDQKAIGLLGSQGFQTLSPQ